MYIVKDSIMTNLDPADIIAGSLQCSRAYALELMRNQLALDEPAPEPMAWMYATDRKIYGEKQMPVLTLERWRKSEPGWCELPLYAAPPAQPAPTGELPPLPNDWAHKTQAGKLLYDVSAMHDYGQQCYAVGLAAQTALCRTDGRCQYAIDHGAEGLGHCPAGKCSMPASQPAPSVPDWSRLYEELRTTIDGGSESMTHADAIEQVRHWAAQPAPSVPGWTREQVLALVSAKRSASKLPDEMCEADGEFDFAIDMMLAAIAAAPQGDKA